MGLTIGGFAVLLLLFMILFVRSVGPIGIILAAVLGAPPHPSGRASPASG
jgi:hypothetical protein